MYKASDVMQKYGYDPKRLDLSRIESWDDFVRAMNYAMMKQFSALENGGRMAVLMGDIKKKGRLYSMLAEIVKPGTLENIIIKAQHNCFSDRTQYSGKFIPNCFNISIHIAEPLASVLYSRMKRLYHTEVWYGRFLLYPLEGGESDVLIAVIIIVTTKHFFIHSMPSWHVAYIAENRAVKRYGFSLLWWHAPRRHENGPQTGISRTG
jgi:hypothetical protein